MNIDGYQWEFQDPYIGLIYGRYLHFRILKFPLRILLVHFPGSRFPGVFWRLVRVVCLVPSPITASAAVNPEVGGEDGKTLAFRGAATAAL